MKSRTINKTIALTREEAKEIARAAKLARTTFAAFVRNAAVQWSRSRTANNTTPRHSALRKKLQHIAILLNHEGSPQ